MDIKQFSELYNIDAHRLHVITGREIPIIKEWLADPYQTPRVLSETFEQLHRCLLSVIPQLKDLDEMAPFTFNTITKYNLISANNDALQKALIASQNNHEDIREEAERYEYLRDESSFIERVKFLFKKV